jgi:hypothetical protein
MENVLQIRLTVRKYTWGEFVHDVCFVLYATIVISNALSKRFLHISLRQLAVGFYKTIVWGFWIFMISMWSYLLINGWLHPQ